MDSLLENAILDACKNRPVSLSECGYCVASPSGAHPLFISLETGASVCHRPQRADDGSVQSQRPSHLDLYISRHPEDRVFLELRVAKLEAAPATTSAVEASECADAKKRRTDDGNGAVNGTTVQDVYNELILRKGTSPVKCDLRLCCVLGSSADESYFVDEVEWPELIRQRIWTFLGQNDSLSERQIEMWNNELLSCTHTVNHPQINHAADFRVQRVCCEDDCDQRRNLWLCLACGSVQCGRRNWDGSGGNGHALLHFERTGHAIAVKLGTITAEGRADVHCYACDEERVHPNLQQALAHWGVNINTEVKSEESLAELELNQNLNLDRTIVGDPSESAAMALAPAPSLIGFRNCGNTCYFASIFQAIMYTPSIVNAFYGTNGAKWLEHISTCTKSPSQCWNCQFGKLIDGINNPSYIPDYVRGFGDGAYHEGLSPLMFKQLVCKNSTDFSSAHQQDAAEFYQFFLTELQRQHHRQQQQQQSTNASSNSSASSTDPTLGFQFSIAQRLQCTQCRRVRHSSTRETLLGLTVPVPDHEVQRQADLEQHQRATKAFNTTDPLIPRVTFDACMMALMNESAADFLCPQCKTATQVNITRSMNTFPDTLVIQSRRFVYHNWVPRKLNVFIEMPETLDLESFRTTDRPADEELLPDDGPVSSSSAPNSSTSSSATPATPSINETLLAELTGFGFDAALCRLALAKLSSTVSLESAMNFVLENSDTLAIELSEQQHGGGSSSSSSNSTSTNPSGSSSTATGAGQRESHEESIQMLASMGFSESRSWTALQKSGYSIERAVEWLFSHMDDMEDDSSQAAATSSDPTDSTSDSASSANETVADSASSSDNNNLVNGSARYRLVALVSHMGKSTGSGHYVAHRRLPDGRWVLFNDEKVRRCDEPPSRLSYMYFYQRVSE